jgi:RNA polymerase sigma-70 factor (ECF subfamily)
MADLRDQELVASIRGGNAHAFVELIRRHHGRVRGLCASLLDDQSELDDAVQEVFLKVHRSLDKFHGDSAFSTWLYRVAMNHCLDVRRRVARRRTQSLDAILESEGEAVSRFLEGSRRERDPAEEAEERAAALAVLSSLPDDYREILALRETQGLSYDEIASVLECSLDAVKARLRRARVELREKLRHFVKEEQSN